MESMLGLKQLIFLLGLDFKAELLHLHLSQVDRSERS